MQLGWTLDFIAVCHPSRQKYLKVVSENANAILAIEPSGKIGKGKMGLSGVQVRLLCACIALWYWYRMEALCCSLWQREWLKTDVTLKLQGT